jgi:hypothetical protein
MVFESLVNRSCSLLELGDLLLFLVSDYHALGLFVCIIIIVIFELVRPDHAGFYELLPSPVGFLLLLFLGLSKPLALLLEFFDLVLFFLLLAFNFSFLSILFFFSLSFLFLFFSTNSF